MSKINTIFKKDLSDILVVFGINEAPNVEIYKNGPEFDFASNAALMFSKKNNKNPRDFANEVKKKLENTGNYKEICIAGPGFINVRVKDEKVCKITKTILTQKRNFGDQEKVNELVNIEYVSANPTGFLHVGHARNAVVGNALEKILTKAGYNVQTEYYVNDAGNQINVLAVTVYVYYLRSFQIEAELPENSYSGEGYEIVSKMIISEFGDKFINVGYSDTKINDDSVHEIFKEKSISFFLKIIKEQLKLIDVEIGYYSSEKKSYEDNLIEKMLLEYKKIGATFEKDGALWLNTTKFGDDKDRVLVKADGNYTYITPDLATHNERLKRTHADKLINVWGGDHHGYIVRMKAGLSLFGYDPDILEIEMVQMVRLIKDGKEFKMSKRKGTAVWLLDLYEMVGKDPLRYMLASKSSSSHMDLDLDLIQTKNSSNPVYYAQYASARCHSILSQSKEKGIIINEIEMSENFVLSDAERELLITLDNFSDIVKVAAKNRAPQLVCDYIQTISKQFHSYYSNTKIINDLNLEWTKNRIIILKSIIQVLSNSFELIGIDLVEKM